MKVFKKLIVVVMSALFLSMLLSGCTKQSGTSQVSFMDLKLGATREEVTAQLGEEYEELGSSVKHLNYDGLRLFDFVPKGAGTTTSVFLNTQDIVYSYAYYIYSNIDENEENIKKLFTEKYGEYAANDAGGVDWQQGELTYTCIRGDDYVAISVY